MNLKRILALTYRIVLQIRRDRRSLAIFVIMPIVILALLTYLINLNSSDISIGIVHDETSELEAKLVRGLQQNTFITIQNISDDQSDILLKNGALDAVIKITEETEHTSRLLTPKITLIVEGSRLQTKTLVAKILDRIVTETSLVQLRPGPLNTEIKYLYGGPEYQAIDYLAPNLVAFFAFFFVYLLTSVGFLRERTQGTLERLRTSPLTRLEIILGYLMGYSIFALFQSTIILLFIIYIIGINYDGSLPIVFLIVIILTIGSINLGIFLSTFARTELQAVQFIPLVIFPQILLSGLIWPVSDMNVILQWIARIFPLTYANNALTDVMIKGKGMLDIEVLFNISALCAFASIMIILAFIGLKRASR